ncbi:type II toxin-antitoxin system RelE/ParE family toxin [Selenomonas sp.]|uniref:type II toxin-antitoxin system RelE/ParE family toxin n=1 Tax=Selenomonas sp. TaxID=2053611 RepID=UPI0025D7F2E3|nr:type II toxin-antitoxin system RelE/ParE family toxin [Selenomonas sp.]MBQ1868436.1 type II toxin-antitoxin system RelE/ParE family toxin [Selenomonas sp.]
MSRDNFNIIYFELDSSTCPVQEFLDSLDDKMAAKMYGMMDILAEYGNELRMPYSEHLEDGIFEVRAKFGSNITRVLYFFYVGKTIVMTNGFVKKQQKTPRRQIELAKKYRKIFLERSATQ